MVELTKFLRYLLIGNIILFSSCDSTENVNEVVNNNVETNIPLTREDSVVQLAKDLKIQFDPKTENINDILNKILISKNSLLLRLDSLDKRADAMESAAIQYKKKENTKLRNQLLSEIEKIKNELDRIKKLSGISDEIIVEDNTAIPEVKVPDMASSLENLPAGNYITRIDKYHLISILVKPDGQIIIGEPKLDSTTVIRGSSKMNSRITKELEQIKQKLKDN